MLSQIDPLKYVLIMDDGSPIDLRPLTKLKRLESLDLFLDSIDEIDLAFLSDLKMLRKFSLSADRITDNGLAPLRSLKHLDELEIYSKPIQSPDGETYPQLASSALAQLANLKQIKCLRLRLDFRTSRHC